MKNNKTKKGKSKSPEKVIEFVYCRDIIKDFSLGDYSKRLKRAGINFKINGKSGKVASFEDIGVFYLVIATPVAKIILDGILWEIIKRIIKRVLKTIKDKKATIISGGKTDKVDIIFKVKVNFPKQKFEFIYPTNFDEKYYEICINNMMESFKKHRLNPYIDYIKYLKYNTGLEKWQFLDNEGNIIEEVKKQKKKIKN